MKNRTNEKYYTEADFNTKMKEFEKQEAKYVTTPLPEDPFDINQQISFNQKKQHDFYMAACSQQLWIEAQQIRLMILQQTLQGLGNDDNKVVFENLIRSQKAKIKYDVALKATLEKSARITKKYNKKCMSLKQKGYSTIPERYLSPFSYKEFGAYLKENT